MTRTLARSVKLLVRLGMLCDRCESWNHFSRTRRDLFGLFDAIAVASGTCGCLGVQATSRGGVPQRVKRIEDSPVAQLWREAGNAILVIGWDKRSTFRGVLWPAFGHAVQALVRLPRSWRPGSVEIPRCQDVGSYLVAVLSSCAGARFRVRSERSKSA